MKALSRRELFRRILAAPAAVAGLALLPRGARAAKNTILTPSQIAKEALANLEPRLTFTRLNRFTVDD